MKMQLRQLRNHPSHQSQNKPQQHQYPHNLSQFIQYLKENPAVSFLNQTGNGLLQTISLIRAALRRNENSQWPDFIANSQAHCDAVRFMDTVRLKDKVDYKWVSDYAKILWEYRAKSIGEIEGKADNIVKYLGGGTGLFAVGILSKIDSSNSYLVWWSLPALVCAITAILLAVFVKIPRFSPSPPAIDNARDYAECFDSIEKATTAFLGQWHVLCTDMKLLSCYKAQLIETSTAFFFAAILLLLLPVLVGATYPPVSAH
jgi:hypothetical protein